MKDSEQYANINTFIGDTSTSSAENKTRLVELSKSIPTPEDKLQTLDAVLYRSGYYDSVLRAQITHEHKRLVCRGLSDLSALRVLDTIAQPAGLPEANMSLVRYKEGYLLDWYIGGYKGLPLLDSKTFPLVHTLMHIRKSEIMAYLDYLNGGTNALEVYDVVKNLKLFDSEMYGISYAYLAGYFDSGKGSFLIEGKDVILSFTSQNLKFLESIRTLVNHGSITPIITPKYTTYTWKLNGQKASETMTQILHYVIYRRKEVLRSLSSSLRLKYITMTQGSLLHDEKGRFARKAVTAKERILGIRERSIAES